MKFQAVLYNEGLLADRPSPIHDFTVPYVYRATDNGLKYISYGGISDTWEPWDPTVSDLGGVENTGVVTSPPSSFAPTLSLDSAYQNDSGTDILLVVYLSVTVNTSGVIKLGVGPTDTPTQQTLVTGVTTVGFLPVTIYLPQSYYALLSVSGTITDSITGQIAMPV